MTTRAHSHQRTFSKEAAMDSISATCLAFGLFLLLASWIQLIIVSFKEDYTWGLSSVFLPPISYAYACFEREKSVSALWLALGGCTLLIGSAL